ncbi:MAG TPA: hypothetical protein VNP73_02945, partial [Actinomycetota bacterium]|nr:hypothetical protein [Actinomycetota bacterium]
MNRILRSAIFYLILIIAVVAIFNFYRDSVDSPQVLESVNDFQSRMETGTITTAKFLTKDEKVVGDCECDEGATKFEVFVPKDTVDDW